MKISLLNTNPVVSRLIELCAKEVNVDVVCIDSLEVEDIDDDTIVIVDDGILDNDIKSVLKSTYLGYRVLLISKGFKDNDLVVFDDIIQKPFVPSRIIDMITSALDKQKIAKYEKDYLSDISIVTDKQTTQILKQSEVDKIKELLIQAQKSVEHIDENDMELKKLQAFKEHLLSDGVEITNEEEYIQSITKKPKKYKKALKSLIDDALDEIIDSVGKDNFKQAIKEDRVSLEFHIKEKE